MKTVKELKKQSRKNDSTSLLLVALIYIITILFSLGNSVLNQKLNISGEAVYRVMADMRITHLSEPTRVNGGDITYNGTYSVNSVSLHVELPNKDSSVEYVVKITNIGNINQWIKSINATSNNENIIYKIENLKPQEDIIYSPNSSENNIKELKIIFSYNDSIKNGVQALPTGDGTRLSTIISFEYEILETYLITYDLDGGSVASNPPNYTKSDTITLNNPTKKGYEFLGWTGTGLDTVTKNVTIPKLSEGDRNYVANWKALPWAFTINPTPANAIVTISDGTQTITGEGSTSLTSNAGNTITWSVSLDHYATQSGKQAILEDITKDISLTSTWSDWATEKEATCTEAGIEYRTCSLCGAKETRKTGLVDHTYNTTTVASTLTTRGHELHTCSVCGHSYKDSYASSLAIVNSSKVTYTAASWTNIIKRAEATGGISTTDTANGKFSSGNPTVSIQNSGSTSRDAVFYIKVNLDGVKSITYDTDLWDTGLKYNILGMVSDKGTAYAKIGLTASQPTTIDESGYISGTYNSASLPRSSSSDSVKALDGNISTSSLSGIHYIKIYLKHSMTKSDEYGAHLRFNKLILNYE